ncbi:MAG: tetratricopeptide repeat protein [Desulfatibacillaceae bacterium]
MNRAGFIHLPLVIVAALFLPMGGCLKGKPLDAPALHLSAGARESAQGLKWHARGCYHRAMEHFERAFELYTAAAQMRGQAESLNNLGASLLGMGDPGRAEAFFTEAATLYTDLADGAGVRRVLCNLSAAYMQLGANDRAAEALSRAAEAARESAPGEFAPLHLRRAALAMNRGLARKAADSYRRVLSSAHPGSVHAAQAHHGLGEAYLSLDRPTDALPHFEAALGLDREAGFHRGMADDLAGAARALAMAGETRRAVIYWKRAAGIYGLLELETPAAEAVRELRALAVKTGAHPGVAEYFVGRWLDGDHLESPCR